MALSEREKIHYELLEALYKARKQVEYLEAALAHNAAFLGTGVERENMPAAPQEADSDGLPEEVLRYIGLVGREEDISDYLGREGHDESRPRLGKDAPDLVRPKEQPRIGRLVGQLAMGHPDDALVLPDLRAAEQEAEARQEHDIPAAGAEDGPYAAAGQAQGPDPADEAGHGAFGVVRRDGDATGYSLDILVAEDDAVNRFAMSMLLGRAGHRAVCVENGLQALEALQLRPFACLITDVRMPVMDGGELVRCLRTGNAVGIEPTPPVLEAMGFDPDARPPLRPLPKNIPVIALTGQSLDVDGRPLRIPGVDLYLSKPLDVRDLQRVLGEVARYVRQALGD